MGGDYKVGYKDGSMGVSIHAPAWGATTALACWLTLIFGFQSTPPHGGRHNLAGRLTKGLGFNPRPRMGGDLIGHTDIHRWELFQSTPPHGGRHSAMRNLLQPRKFQSTPPHGGRLNFLLACGHAQSFNPRPRMGGDCFCLTY